MFCPSCRSEYLAGITACPDCGAPLVAALPPKPARPPADELELVTVLETGDGFLLARAKAILDEAQIPFLVKGEGLQDLFGLGRIGAGYNQVVGPVLVQVPRGDEAAARELLSTTDGGDSGAAENAH